MVDDSNIVTASLMIIGNEILSGRTVDANLPHLAKTLGAIGVRLLEARVVPDDEAAIVEAIDALRFKYHYVFTTGGIGPTHDDITSRCIAKAFARPLERNQEALRRLLDYYPPDKVNEGRLKMADMPEEVELIDNPVSIAPGYRIENVFVMAGVPKIMEAMLDGVLPMLHGGEPMLSKAITVLAPEGDLAVALANLQLAHDQVEIGSYPFFRPSGPSATIVFRSDRQDDIDKAAQDLLDLAETLGLAIEEGGRV